MEFLFFPHIHADYLEWSLINLNWWIRVASNLISVWPVAVSPNYGVIKIQTAGEWIFANPLTHFSCHTGGKMVLQGLITYSCKLPSLLGYILWKYGSTPLADNVENTKVYAGPTNLCQHSTTDLARGIMTNECKQSALSEHSETTSSFFVINLSPTIK